jgi:ferritin-like metal-binding protein YciE
MPARDLSDQLDKYLADAHSIEQQALAQMRSAPTLTDEPALSAAFAAHLAETEQHEALVRERLLARRARPATVKDLAGLLTGKSFVAFARVQPDTSGKLVAHAYSYEHMELAAYVLLTRVSELAGDEDTARVARTIGAQEAGMGERLASLFDVAAGASVRGLDEGRLTHRLDSYLADAHAIEHQSLALLGRAPRLAGTPALADAYEHHLTQTREHVHLLEERLRERGSSPSRVKDAAMRVGALNWAAFFGLQPDTPAKLAGFAFAFEHLEIASYELLGRVAETARDEVTAALADRILADERSASGRIGSLLEDALAASLEELGVAA